jgi:ABC-type maltose transport system permease subunit
MIKHNHTISRLIIDSILVITLVLLILSPVFMVFSLKINDLNLQTNIIKTVAGAKTIKN